jgi:putative spermidine/putrescine transport system ATP-binding protein
VRGIPLHAASETAMSSPASDTLVQFRGVQKTYDGDTLVVRSLDLDIRRGEFLSLLGPSGSGKTTCLMMLAGFESPTAGEILLDGKPITRTPPHKRNFGMVFQNYALFPHMTVADNVAYPLTVRKMPKGEIAQRVRKALASVQLTHRDSAYPSQLSGGQQQRVALARALVFEPQLVLMDEPLGALDKQLREQMQYEIKRIHAQSGLTIVYVTHDQDEAMTMSDRIAVFNNGRIQQLAAPSDLYETPDNAFVGRFIGESISTSEGSNTSARATAMRCCWPPDSCPGMRSANFSIVTIASARRTLASMSALGTLRTFSGKARFSRTDMFGNSA